MNPTRSKAATLVLSLLVLVSGSATVASERTIAAADLYDKLRGMWMGELIGNAAGRDTEGVYDGAEPNPDPSVPWQIKRIWDGDDDTDLEYLAVHVLETYGLDPNNVEIGRQWLDHVTEAGIFIANRQAWFLLNDGYLPPETGSRSHNIHWYAIDSQITTEVLGAVCPGLPQAAIDLAGRFGRVTNEGFPVHAAQFYAAMYAHAFFESDVLAIVLRAMQTIPTTSRTHHVIEDVLNWYLQDALDDQLDWRSTRAKLYDKYAGPNSFGRYLLWIESTVNTGATTLAILYGQGDFKQTVQIGVLAGWDCDCNPATAGGLIGIIRGLSGLPADLVHPRFCGYTYENRFRPGLPDPNLPLPQTESIMDFAFRLTVLAEQNILSHGGYDTIENGRRILHVPEQPFVETDPEKPDPAGPDGLVADALAAGIAVVPTAAAPKYNPRRDLDNLSAIIDGIKDNSYNGHRPYSSYTPFAWQRPSRDWYQLAFSKPVRFDRVVFHEGDRVWQGINAYHRQDDARGGFFEDLTVEILKNGRYVRPVGLEMTPPLDPYEMYQTLTFAFSPMVGTAVRIIGTPGGSQQYTTIMELEIHGDLDPGFYVTEVVVADDQPQRSTIDNIQIQFSRPTEVDKADLTLAGLVNGTVIPMSLVDLEYDPDAQRLYLFMPDSMPDDVYELRLDTGAVTDPNGLPLLDEDSNPGDGWYTIRFHKLFGDADGSTVVDCADLLTLAAYWLGLADGTGLDVNRDDVLDMFDLAAFARNWRLDP